MVGQLRATPSHPDIHVTKPCPNYKPGVYGMNHTVINYVFPAILPQSERGVGGHQCVQQAYAPLPFIARARSLPPAVAAADTPGNAALDIFDCMGGVNMTDPQLFADGCHPNAAGYAVLAKCFQTALGL